MEHGESRQHLVIAVTDWLHAGAAISAAAARLEAAVQLVAKWLCRFPHMEVLLPQLCGGSGRSGAPREGTRAQAITAVSLFARPSAAAGCFFCGVFIYCLHKAPHAHLSIQCVQDKHKQGGGWGGNVGCARGSRRGCASVWRLRDGTV